MVDKQRWGREGEHWERIGEVFTREVGEGDIGVFIQGGRVRRGTATGGAVAGEVSLERIAVERRVAVVAAARAGGLRWTEYS